MTRREGRSTRPIQLLIGLLVLCAVGMLVQPNGAQAASRLALTAALEERGTVVIDAYAPTLGADYAQRDGHLYSDKAPGQPILAIPAWALYRAVGGEPGTVLRVQHHLGLWWVTLWSSTIPAALLGVAMWRHARRLTGKTTAATVATLAFAFGTLLLPFSTLLFGHVLAALLGFASFLLLRPHLTEPEVAPDHPPAAPLGRPTAAVLAGLSIGSAVAVEYTVAIVAVVLAAAVVIRIPRSSGWFALGGLLPAALLAGYHTVAFGGPAEHPYAYSVFDLHHSTFAGIGAPDASVLTAVLVGDRGLLTLTPVIGVAIAGLIASRRHFPSADLAVPGAVLALYLVFAAGWIDPTGGSSPGPRHLVPAIPFLVGGLASAWVRWPRFVVAASSLSIATMVVATLGNPQLPANASPALRLWVDRFLDGQGPTTLLSPFIGRGGLLVVAFVVGVLGVMLVRTSADVDPADVSSQPPTRA